MTCAIRVTKLRHECLCCHYKQNSCHKITTRMFVLPLQAKFVSQNYDTNLCLATTSKIRVTKLRHESLSCHYKLNSCHEITTRIFVLPLAKFVSRNYDTNLCLATTTKFVSRNYDTNLCLPLQANSCHEITTRIFVLPLQFVSKFVSRNCTKLRHESCHSKFVRNYYESFSCHYKIRVTKLRHESLCCHYKQNSCHKITTRILVWKFFVL